MKRSLIMLFMGSISGQVYADSGPHIGFKGGVNAATLDHEFRENRYDFTGGIVGYLQRQFFDRYFIAAQIEILYTPRGANVFFEGEKQAEFRESYCDLMAAARPGIQLGRASVYLLLGGGANFLVSATRENVSGSKEDITDDLRRIDIALVGGAGIALQLPRSDLGPFHIDTVFLEARHDIGLIDTDTANGGYKNRTSSLMLGLSFVVRGSSGPDTAQPIK